MMKLTKKLTSSWAINNQSWRKYYAMRKLFAKPTLMKATWSIWLWVLLQQNNYFPIFLRYLPLANKGLPRITRIYTDEMHCILIGENLCNPWRKNLPKAEKIICIINK